MELALKGKKALITGGTRGIGRAIAEAFASEGTDIAICARTQEGLDETAQALRAIGVRTVANKLDVSDGARLKEWIAEAAQSLGGIDILVSNVGAMVGENSEEHWESNFKVDILGAVRSVQVAKPFLEAAAKTSGDASIIIISSVVAGEADNESSYGPMKAALIHFAKGVAREQAHNRIRANVISPGSVHFKGGYWDLVENNDPAFFKETLARYPMGRMATTRDVANAALFLASPVSSFITGTNLIVDGGYSPRVSF